MDSVHLHRVHMELCANGHSPYELYEQSPDGVCAIHTECPTFARFSVKCPISASFLSVSFNFTYFFIFMSFFLKYTNDLLY
jgi:hypothetical protein